MIWHFVEVWLWIAAAFVVGCAVGALAHTLVARSRLAPAQGVVSDSIGDAVDRLKDRLGVGPAWRPSHERAHMAEPDDAGEWPEHHDSDPDAAFVESGGVPGYENARTPRPAAGIDDGQARAQDAAVAPRRRARVETPVRRPAADRSRVDAPVGAGRIPAPAARHSAAGRDAPSGTIVPKRPATLAEPRNGVPDNLQRIQGVGERNEARLNKLGIFHFGQIAAWTPAEVLWVSQRMAFPERMERDDWVGQAIILASGGDTGMTKAADRRRTRRQEQRRFRADRWGDYPADDDEVDES